MSHNFKVGQRVFWNDPDGECSAYYNITTISGHDEDSIIAMSNESGSYCECYPNELDAVVTA